ncbi:hypothetical protein ICW40_01180 [Actinotalea ferrariae]|uniref:hypothetical protein n=1 Tax=Actinotalea ferrariae TaxID=1386098 RepID=UPI001C8C39C8|nr:hypothetical protein [Actinotalea ferrariae]MBX9243418.1 hypothetical protein [Actinotalea ferrariae]
MTTMQIAGRLLAADAGARTLTYRLLPYGEGRTNRGKVLASRGCVTLPDDPGVLRLNDRHIAGRDLATGTSLEWGEEALIASFHVHEGPAGDALLEEAEQAKTNPTPGVELRASASVEVDNPIIRAGKLLGGLLTGAAAVVRPAFDGATLLAADAGDLPEGLAEDSSTQSESVEEITVDGVTYVRKTTSTYKTETTPKDAPEGDDAEQSAESETEMGETLTAAAAAGLTQTPHGGGKPTKTAEQVFRLLASSFKSGGQDKLLAALADVTHDDGDNDGDGLGEITAAPEWLGEVWATVPYARKWIPLVATAPLTSYRQKGFHFGTKPLVQKYSGNKAAIPTSGMTATPVDYLTDRWAHGADLDRRYIDFGDSDVLRAFVEAQVESYRKETDLDTHDGLFDLATTFTPGTVPTGVDAGLAALVDGSLDLIGRDLNPSFAIVGSDLYRNLLFTLEQKGLKFLTMALGLEEGQLDGFRIRPSGRASALGKVLVGDGATVVFKEFGGGTPVRVEAEHVANGGRDLAVFGYTSLQDRTPSSVAGVVVADLVA